jgi:general secretion pathway protein C
MERALNHNRRMAARLSAFIVWAALAASAVFWGLRLAGASPVAPPHTVPVGDAVVPHADLTRLFGAEPVKTADTPAPAPESSRFKLIGLAAPRTAGGPGVALISIEGKPARAYRIGATVDGNLVLQEVERRSVALGPRGSAATVRLELPALPPPATGSLPPPAGLESPAPAVSPPPGMPMPQPGMPPVGNSMRPMPQQAPTAVMQGQPPPTEVAPLQPPVTQEAPPQGVTAQ